jgi:hypothetical protein
MEQIVKMFNLEQVQTISLSLKKYYFWQYKQLITAWHQKMKS